MVENPRRFDKLKNDATDEKGNTDETEKTHNLFDSIIMSFFG